MRPGSCGCSVRPTKRREALRSTVSRKALRSIVSRELLSSFQRRKAQRSNCQRRQASAENPVVAVATCTSVFLEPPEVRLDRNSRRAIQELGNVGVDAAYEILGAPHTRLEPGKDLLVAKQAVRDVLLDLALRVVDCGTVRGKDPRDIEREEPCERIEVIAEIAIGRNHGGAGAQHDVAR